MEYANNHRVYSLMKERRKAKDRRKVIDRRDEIDHRSKLNRLLNRADISLKQAAEILSLETGDQIEERTVHRWACDPDMTGARRCPGWVIRLLSIGLERNK